MQSLTMQFQFGNDPKGLKWVEMPSIPRDGDVILWRGPDYFDQAMVLEVRWTIYPDSPAGTFCRVVCTEPTRQWDPEPEPVEFTGTVDDLGRPQISPEAPGATESASEDQG